MRYERPMIVHRVAVQALLRPISSDTVKDALASDVQVKENITPIAW